MSSHDPQVQKYTQETLSDPVSPLQRLVHWFNANGGHLSPDVDIVFTSSLGYHCRAVRRLSSAVVAQCPLSLTLSYLNLDHTQSIVPHVQSPLAKCLGQLSNNVLTYLLLVEQRLDSEKACSKWSPYLACLPEPGAMTTPLWFDHADMQSLAGTNLARETGVKLHQLTEEWNQARQVLDTVGIHAKVYTFELFLWAATIISSRAFISTHVIPGMETFPILFPVVDILNHSPTAKVEWDFHPLQDFTLKILSHEEIQPGDEIYNNYAPKQNDELLLGYGFCVPDNPVEQFAIKMRLNPEVEQAARSMNLFHPTSIPFGMDTSFLTDTKDEPEYMRSKGHPFGRYQNRLPFFRGIPPSIVHMFYIRALMNLNLHPKDIRIEALPSRVVFETLLLAYEAIDKRSETLPFRLEQQASLPNEKQKYATIYRDGQAKIIHAIRNELNIVISALRTDRTLPDQPAIVSTTDMLGRLSSEFPSPYLHFKAGLEQQYGVNLSSLSQYSADVSSLEAGEQPAELSVWKLLLCLLLVLYQRNKSGATQNHDASDQRLFSWVEYLVSLQPLPMQGADMDAEMLQDFVIGWEGNKDMLEKAYTWADEVVNRFAFPLDEQLQGEEIQRICMYMEVASKQGNGDWDWMWKETEETV